MASEPNQFPPDAELRDAALRILRSYDLEKTTFRMLMKMLAEQFDIAQEDMVLKKKFVRSVVDRFLDEGQEELEEIKMTSAKKSNKRKSTATPAEDKPVKLTGLEKAVVLCDSLAKFIGEKIVPRSQINKKIAAYAKEHGLKDPDDGRKMHCDDDLREALGVDSFTFFTLSKIVSGLVHKVDESNEEMVQLAKEVEEKFLEEKKAKKAEEIANGTAPKKAKKKQTTKGQAAKGQTSKGDTPKRPSPFTIPMKLSDDLVAICGEAEMSRTDVMKRIWDHIKAQNLQDPKDRRTILCDDKLKAVFNGVESVQHMGMAKYLNAHLTKIE